MLTYCLKRGKDTKYIDAKMMKTKNGGLMLFSKCAVCGNNYERTRSKRIIN